jgi:hypothetical protein
VAIAVMLAQLWAIAGIRSRYMDTEVVVGGLIVFAAGIPIAQTPNVPWTRDPRREGVDNQLTNIEAMYSNMHC